MKVTKALRFTLVVAVAGLITVLLVIYTQHNTINTYTKNQPLILLADHVNLKITKARLLFEAFLSEGKSLDFEKDILTSLTNAQQILQAASDGKETALGTFETADEETQMLIKETLIAINKLNIAINNHWTARKQSDVRRLNLSDSIAREQASEIFPSARALNDAYGAVEKTIARLATHVQNDVENDGARVRTVSWATTFVLFSAVGLLSLLAYKLQTRTDRLQEDHHKKLDEETNRVETLSNFIEAVSSGNYNIDLNTGSGDDHLTSTLVTMRDKLRANAEDDRKRNWSTSGLAQIGEILRAANTSTSQLYDNIIKFVVKYTKSTQGGLFLINEEEENNKFLELVACYAFERKKYLTRQVQPGEGLVGQCYLEGERIYLLEVPQNYIAITSGLGGANPRALLIVPLKINDVIYGVIELASFNNYAQHEIELVEKFAETIASTISSVRVNDTTRQLLERTQQQAEEMKAQEEEIRQNMEELEATQEEMRRKQGILEKELEQSQKQTETLMQQEKKLTVSRDTLQSIVDHMPRAIYWKDKDLRFMGCNRIFASMAGASSTDELIGKSDFDMQWSNQAEAYRNDDLEVMRKRQDKLDVEEVRKNNQGEEAWVLTSKVPVISNDGEVIALLGMLEDITTRKRQEADIARKLKEREDALKELTALKQLMQTKKT